MLDKSVQQQQQELCPNCKECFPCSITLKVHSQEVHSLPNVKQFISCDDSNNIDNPTNIKSNNNSSSNQLLVITYECDICENHRSFSTRELLVQHSNIHLLDHKCHSAECQEKLYGGIPKLTNKTEFNNVCNSNNNNNNKDESEPNSNRNQQNSNPRDDPTLSNYTNRRTGKSGPSKNPRTKQNNNNKQNKELLTSKRTTTKKLKQPNSSSPGGESSLSNPGKLKRCSSSYLYQCKTCQKVLSNKISYIEHNRIHTERERPIYKCPVCCSVFTIKNTFKQHMAVHTTLNKQQYENFRCKLCNQCFSQKLLLTRHYLSAHNNGESCFICEICSEIFPDEQFYLIHAQVHFSREIKKTFFICRICNTKFIGKDMYERHSCRFAGVVSSR